PAPRCTPPPPSVLTPPARSPAPSWPCTPCATRRKSHPCGSCSRCYWPGAPPAWCSWCSGGGWAGTSSLVRLLSRDRIQHHPIGASAGESSDPLADLRSEEHTSELQS